MVWPAWLNPSSWGKAAQLAARIDLYEKLDAAREQNSKLRDERDDIRAERDTLRDENKALRKELAQLRESFALAAQKPTPTIMIDRNAAWRLNEDQSRAGPFCQTCWGKDGKLIPLTVAPRVEGKRPSGKCGNCTAPVFLVDSEEIERRADPPPSSATTNWMDERF